MFEEGRAMFFMARFSMKNYLIIIEYDGTRYFGWQRQKDNGKMPTIQGTIENSLKRIFAKKIVLTGSGRTDTGVHARGQAASFKVTSGIPPEGIQRALNTYLPDDILVRKIKEVPLSFNARHSACKKRYRYTILNQDWNTPLQRYYAAHWPYRLDLRKMKQAARLIKGEHDFSAIVLTGKGNKVRRIHEIKISQKINFIYIDITGNGFLYKMVRRITGILLGAGSGRIKLADVRKLVSGVNPGCNIKTAPAYGLTLEEVIYSIGI